MFCSVCGSWVEENAAFCPNCGAAINGNVQKKDNSTMQEHGNAAADVQDGYIQIDGTMEFVYHPYGVACLLNRAVPVSVDNYYVTANGNSIDRAHISGTKQGYRRKTLAYIAAIFCGLMCFSTISMILVCLPMVFTGISGAGVNAAEVVGYMVGYIVCAVLMGILTVLFWRAGKEYVLIIKGSGSADAITISTDARHRRELDPIEEAVRALAVSHDHDTNVRIQGQINRAHSEHQTDRIIDAINRK